MKSNNSKPPSRTWTPARLESLSGSQVKALLVVASQSGVQSRLPSAESLESNVDRLLADMSRAHEGSNAGLLDQASNEATAVGELVRIKDLAKVLIEEAPDNRHREAARLLYHAAVAAAFVHHGASISGRPMQKQQLLYDRLAATWAGQTIGRLFREAAALINSQDSSRNSQVSDEGER